MSEEISVAEQFEEHRGRLRAVAYRMLGSLSEADDAVQETWLRLSRSDADEIDNLGGWLTTVVARVCLNMLRSRPDPARGPARAARARPDREPRGRARPRAGGAARRLGRSRAARRARDCSTPPSGSRSCCTTCSRCRSTRSRPMVNRTPAAARQLASRARRRVQGAPEPDTDLAGQREVVDAFFAAARDGDFDALVAVLDPDVVLRADGGALRSDVTRIVRGAEEVAVGRDHLLPAVAVRAARARQRRRRGGRGAAGRLFSVMAFTVRNGQDRRDRRPVRPRPTGRTRPHVPRRLTSTVSTTGLPGTSPAG